jgi:hypothetical protein
MVWMQPQLTDPKMGPTAEIKKLQHMLLYAFPKYSRSHEEGVIESGIFDEATDRALRNVQTHVGGKFVQPGTLGVLTYDTKILLQVITVAPAVKKRKFPQQGVGFDTSAFMMGNPSHSYIDALNEGTTECLRLASLAVGAPKVLTGYSMGDDIMNHVLWNWPADRRDEVKLVVGFGCPSRNPGPTLLGDNPPGVGISGLYTPDWARSRTYQFCMPGDMYPEAVGLLPQLYQILIRMEASLEFMTYLFGLLTSSFGGPLLGLVGSVVPGFGVLSGLMGLIGGTSSGGGLLGGLGGLIGGTTQQSAIIPGTQQPINLIAMMMNIPAIIETLVAALKFMMTNAHYHYHDTPQPQWRGLTAVDCAAQIIQEKVPGGAIVYTIPGTVANWNDGPPAWTAWKLP